MIKITRVMRFDKPGAIIHKRVLISLHILMQVLIKNTVNFQPHPTDIYIGDIYFL